jgi:sigma-E factor negative regulatory protein RseC
MIPPMSNEVCNTGVIRKIENGKIEVAVTRTAACVSCQLAQTCNTAETKVEYIEIPFQGDVDFRVGDKVEVVIKETKAFLAVLYAFIIPILLVVVAIILANAWLNSESYASLIGLGVGVLYYLVLLLLNDRMKKSFQFTIRKHEEAA